MSEQIAKTSFGPTPQREPYEPYAPGTRVKIQSGQRAGMVGYVRDYENAVELTLILERAFHQQRWVWEPIGNVKPCGVGE